MSFTTLIVDDEVNARDFIGGILSGWGYEVQGAATLEEARQCIRRGTADIILLDVQLPDGYGPDLLEETAYLPIRPPIIVITSYGDISMAVDSMKSGAHDFIPKPIDWDNLKKSLERAGELVRMRRELAHLRSTQHQDLDYIVSCSRAMQILLDHANRAAQNGVSVLITGENGTGKDVLARAIHAMGPRRDKPFVPVNCAAIQPTMLESELFGYEPGAFTGAEKRKPGLIELADTGILFLDEISSMPVDMQAKLLRVLEDHMIRRVGGTREFKVDVQIVAATNRNLSKMVEQGTFREDLYYRLKVLDLHIPPLRERKEDIPDLVGLFIRQNNQNKGLNISGVTPRAMQALMNYHWPGNIRELRNVIERATLFCDEAEIDLPQLPKELEP